MEISQGGFLSSLVQSEKFIILDVQLGCGYNLMKRNFSLTLSLNLKFSLTHEQHWFYIGCPEKT